MPNCRMTTTKEKVLGAVREMYCIYMLFAMFFPSPPPHSHQSRGSKSRQGVGACGFLQQIILVIQAVHEIVEVGKHLLTEMHFLCDF